MTRKRKDRERRKAVRRLRQQAKMAKASERIRRHFSGKARSGDAAEVLLQFSGKEVIIDPEHPEALAERDALSRIWEKKDHTTKGSS